MARPKKAPEEQRKDGHNPRMTIAERLKVERYAEALGLSPSEFIRRRALGYSLPVSLAERCYIDHAVATLNRLGVNLNQVARHHLVAWIWQETSRIRYLWRLTDSEISSLFNWLAYPCNKVTPGTLYL